MEVGDGSLVVALKGRVAGDYRVLLSFGARLLRGSPFVASLRSGRPSEMTCITLLDGLHAGGPGNVRSFPTLCGGRGRAAKAGSQWHHRRSRPASVWSRARSSVDCREGRCAH
jgi:hypothetical protein